MVVRAGDSDCGKRDRQPLFFPMLLLATHETSATSLERGNKKSAVPPTLTQAWADCAFSGQL
jgi:hypothetical protein